jgi:hypothetical protein
LGRQPQPSAINYDGAKDEEAVVQIMGMGLVTTTQIEPAAAGSPGRR